MNNKNNNFDFLRLLFACFVLITHSYPLSGIPECDPLCQLTNYQTSFSYIGVRGFFVISGYLIFLSLQRSNSVIEFYKKRILRIYPGLFVVLLVTVLFIPFVYEGKTLFHNYETILTYMPRNLSLYFLQHNIKGVFENNPYKSAINGSLWTISFEFTMYLLISILFFFKKNKNFINVLLITSFLILLFLRYFFYNYLNLSFQLFIDLALFFNAGNILATFDLKKIHNKKYVVFVVLTIIFLSFIFNFHNYVKYFLLSIFIILFCLKPIPYLCKLGEKVGDLSYGIYLYSFPIQQSLMYFFKFNHTELMFYGLLISIILAFFSWHFVEKKALKLKSINIFTKVYNLNTKSNIKTDK